MSNNDVDVELFLNVDVVSNRHFEFDIFDIFEKYIVYILFQIYVSLARINFRPDCLYEMSSILNTK